MAVVPKRDLSLEDLVGRSLVVDDHTLAPCPYCTHLVDFGVEDGPSEGRCGVCGRELVLRWGVKKIEVLVKR